MNGVIILGTASDSGKSMICTALCRILANENIKVAPFKTQNLSAFTEVIVDGKEISRAQFIQAEAAKTTATIYMNPIMLKLKNGVRAEVNLNDREVVNMRVADIANVPAILVAHIDKGGAIASVVGTLQLLTKEYRARVKGIMINKFHGDIASFQEGIDFIESYTGIPVVGVIPYKGDHRIEEEDAERPLTKAPIDVDVYEEWAEHVQRHLNWTKVKEIIEQGGLG